MQVAHCTIAAGPPGATCFWRVLLMEHNFLNRNRTTEHLKLRGPVGRNAKENYGTLRNVFFGRV